MNVYHLVQIEYQLVIVVQKAKNELFNWGTYLQLGNLGNSWGITVSTMG